MTGEESAISGTEMQRFGRRVKLEPHPSDLTSAIASTHVVVFQYHDEGVQFEISGETEHTSLDIDWTTIKIDADEVERMLEDGHVYREQCETMAGKTYELQVRAGELHPKGTPVHTEGGDSL